MRAFQYVVIGRKDEAGFDDPHSFFFIFIEEVEQEVGVTQFKGIRRLFDFVLMEDIAVGGRFVPLEVIDVFYALNVHGQSFHAVCDFRRYGGDVDAADLLEVGKLRDFHAVEPDFPAKAPGAEGRRFPVIFDEADVVFGRVDAQRFQAL